MTSNAPMVVLLSEREAAACAPLTRARRILAELRRQMGVTVLKWDLCIERDEAWLRALQARATAVSDLLQRVRSYPSTTVWRALAHLRMEDARSRETRFEAAVAVAQSILKQPLQQGLPPREPLQPLKMLLEAVEREISRATGARSRAMDPVESLAYARVRTEYAMASARVETVRVHLCAQPTVREDVQAVVNGAPAQPTRLELEAYVERLEVVSGAPRWAERARPPTRARQTPNSS